MSAVIALSLQALVYESMLQTPAHPRQVQKIPTELIIFDHSSNLPAKTFKKEKRPARSATSKMLAPPSRTQQIEPEAYDAPPASVQNFGRQLSACWKFDSKRDPSCGSILQGPKLDSDTDLSALTSQVRNEAHWREELEKENSPTNLPCHATLTAGGRQITGVDLPCIAGALTNEAIQALIK